MGRWVIKVLMETFGMMVVQKYAVCTANSESSMYVKGDTGFQKVCMLKKIIAMHQQKACRDHKGFQRCCLPLVFSNDDFLFSNDLFV